MIEIKMTCINNEIFDDALSVRYEVFCDGQGIPREKERDEKDASAVHVVLYERCKPKACGRVYFEEDYAKIGRVAVLKAEERRGFGTQICNELLKIAFERGAECAVLHSQLTAEGFYKTLDFISEGEVFLEEDIPHIKMTKVL